MSIGTGIAIAGIWFGAALLGRRADGGTRCFIALFAAVATLFAAAFAR